LITKELFLNNFDVRVVILRVPIQCFGGSMAAGIELGLVPLGKSLPLTLKPFLQGFRRF
jgi:hypothetical protein